MRLGVGARLIGRGAPGAAPAGADLGLQLAWLLEAIGYMRARRIACFRLPAALVGRQGQWGGAALARAGELIDAVRDAVAQAGVRLSAHIPPGLGPAAEQETIAAHWAGAVTEAGALLGALGGADWVVVSHLGGAHSRGDPPGPGLLRASRRIAQIPEPLRRRLVFEVDEDAYCLSDLLELHRRCGSAVVFDLLHHHMNNPARISAADGLRLAIATWPPGLRPKAHISTQRTEAHLVPDGRGRALRVVPPRAGQHADFINPFEFAR